MQAKTNNMHLFRHIYPTFLPNRDQKMLITSFAPPPFHPHSTLWGSLVYERVTASTS